MKPIPYGKQNITDEDIQAVIETLKSDYLTQGPKVGEFERAFAEYIGCKYAVALANGTAALHLSAITLNIKPGDKVITTPITFAATANCVRYCGGEVIFADIDPQTYLLDIKKVERLLVKAPRGSYKGIIAVDFAGLSVDLQSYRKLADEYGLWIIEDACHAPGGFFIDCSGQKQYCGNGKFANLAIFSFHPVKHIATGEGGMITTNDRELYEKLLMLRTHGITRDVKFFKNDTAFASGDPLASEYPGWYMEMHTLGYNYRITDFQAALGISQLKRANNGLNRRREIALRYLEAFKDHSRIICQSGFLEGHAYHLFVIQTSDRLKLYNHLRKNNILAQVHYIPTHLMPYYRNQGWKPGDMSHAEKYYSECLSLPIFPTLTSEEQDFIIDTILDFLK
jgi:UDP-4-amino-4,6-dideoxy-N-acetyl-beta-L-altrosamine transaminase